MALLDLTIRSSIEELQTLADRVDAVAETKCWPQKTLFALQVSLDEWISNVIKYSYQNQPGRPIRVTIEQDAQAAMSALGGRGDLVVCIEDEGSAFDPSDSEVPTSLEETLSGQREGGMGLFVMRHLLKDIAYHQRKGRNIVTLRIGLC